MFSTRFFFINRFNCDFRRSVDLQSKGSHNHHCQVFSYCFLTNVYEFQWIIYVHMYFRLCPVNCAREFLAFVAVLSFKNFIGAAGRSSNFLISVRFVAFTIIVYWVCNFFKWSFIIKCILSIWSCVNEHDKTVAMGFGLMLLGLAFIPSPIFFGMILDYACLVWGKTCSGSGNCWLYDGKVLRYVSIL